MAKYTFKILRCEHRKFLKYVIPFFNTLHARAKNIAFALISDQKKSKTKLTENALYKCILLVDLGIINLVRSQNFPKN